MFNPHSLVVIQIFFNFPPFTFFVKYFFLYTQVGLAGILFMSWQNSITPVILISILLQTFLWKNKTDFQSQQIQQLLPAMSSTCPLRQGLKSSNLFSFISISMFSSTLSAFFMSTRMSTFLIQLLAVDFLTVF